MSFTPNVQLPTLQVGMAPDVQCVKAWQGAVNAKWGPIWGYYLTVDGVYGSVCQLACSVIQATLGLNNDGVCGPKTWNGVLGGDGPF